MSENTDYDKACREIARIAAALGIIDYSGDTSEIFDSIIIKDENHQVLAGDNVVLKSAIEFATAPDMWEEHGDLLEYKYLDWYVDVLNKALDGTTATTQALNEIKAQGVEMFSEFCKQKAEIRAYNFFTDAGNVAEEFAASLRSEHHG
ncbi:hypothetical protein AXW38_12135 [Yersinia ruckeri]|uniref:hypothetical protein n=1 Tax=Yersinia ruckeri TaxID=29486 RepID=UPI0004E338FE|nr:hypothetical protein [Yersinia ruckeri]ARZ01794.1 hypothetical protein QMA0440_02472 [Yersinia ruckeri]KFE38516.1 hypothetical protein nADLYRO1b_2324 [Yersinia ruckeri]OIX32779.1 hypothetical protein AXW19_12070 [Yersinia ruckeri]OIX32998.1 hypothetical protein AXW18_12085 [Yersinia ruckeri]OIX33216.1 hypothetical protein AXW20_12095 [Yersinia ruckeri]